MNCIYCHDLESSPRVWAKGEVIGKNDKYYLVKAYTPFNIEGFVEFEIDKENVVMI